jgi:hypothetical protein
MLGGWVGEGQVEILQDLQWFAVSNVAAQQDGQLERHTRSGSLSRRCRPLLGHYAGMHVLPTELRAFGVREDIVGLDASSTVVLAGVPRSASPVVEFDRGL